MEIELRVILKKAWCMEKESFTILTMIFIMVNLKMIKKMEKEF